MALTSRLTKRFAPVGHARLRMFTTDTTEEKTASDTASRSLVPVGPEGSLAQLLENTEIPVRFSHVAKAAHRIRGGVLRTDLKRSHWLSELCGCDVHLKLELNQFTGSFKERGGRNALLSLTPEQRKNGVIAASAGNHALALAWHGSDLGIPATVLMPSVAPLQKVEKCRAFGADVVIVGESIADAKNVAETEEQYANKTYINGYDDPEIIAGAGTMGLEIVDQLPNVDFCIIPTGGAGLLAGTSLAIKTLSPECQVIGVETDTIPSMAAAIAAGEPVSVPARSTLADGLAVPKVGTHAFLVARRYTDQFIQVTEQAVALAVLRLVETEKMVVEGGGAAGLAAILPGGPMHRAVQGKQVVIPLCGGNIDTSTLGRVIDRGLAADSRLIRFVAQVSDRPGGIAGLADVLSRTGASIKDIYHERAWLTSSVAMVQVKCVIETTGIEHSEQIRAALEEQYPVAWGPVHNFNSKIPPERDLSDKDLVGHAVD